MYSPNQSTLAKVVSHFRVNHLCNPIFGRPVMKYLWKLFIPSMRKLPPSSWNQHSQRERVFNFQMTKLQSFKLQRLMWEVTDFVFFKRRWPWDVTFVKCGLVLLSSGIHLDFSPLPSAIVSSQWYFKGDVRPSPTNVDQKPTKTVVKRQKAINIRFHMLFAWKLHT